MIKQYLIINNLLSLSLFQNNIRLTIVNEYNKMLDKHIYKVKSI